MLRRSLYIEVGEKGIIKIEIDGQPVIASAIKFEATVGSVPQLKLEMPFIPLTQEMKAAKLDVGGKNGRNKKQCKG